MLIITLKLVKIRIYYITSEIIKVFFSDGFYEIKTVKYDNNNSERMKNITLILY